MAHRTDSDVVRRTLDTDAEEPTTEIIKALADIEGKDETQLGALWNCTDGVLENLFSDPPSPDAEMQVSFTFEGYRISVHQNGQVLFQDPA
jgi:hypothetical protein